ncbi:A/G-specific adenine glycosylase [Microbulbifer agarilyticus]|uniref:Adenine DNA glycosylase n=1 Tax=Microbulbifer agarilyticus TaxID=260552 RepID=A0A1Q2M8I0_9GAMM|nr:A/G-specific adenine glycosylase [Microbulbifer agarilyticus]AQQ69055.1 A/G-specific adenine glycosylase [Microbulbifer agarilyticus]
MPNSASATISPSQFQRTLLKWFDQHGRHDLPWQQDINTYRVWVSEIMLQQTQVVAVIPYYQRFMESFPTVEALAAASQDQVLAHWSGLGYYARARNLHKCAQTVVNEHNGEFPRSVEALAELPGIGRSTAGAIASISMGLEAAILDGNVKRVLARMHALEGWPGQTAVAKGLWEIAEQYTPAKRTGDYTQAMMDLGATLCTRSKPACERCPFAKHCVAHAQGNPTDYPGKKPKKEKPVRQTTLLLIEHDGELYLEQRPASGIWGGLWIPPELEGDDGGEASAQEWLAAQDLDASELQALPPMRHTFSHFHLDIHPVWISLPRKPDQVAEGASGWYKLRQLDRPRSGQDLGLPAPIAKLVKQLTAMRAPLLAPC